LNTAGGLVELFALDTDCNQRNGTTASSLQGQWLQRALTASNATWKFVLMHHSPFSSSTSHGTNPRVQWWVVI
jgi:phosphodiesterase/alkaline phosphatase D-like protein